MITNWAINLLSTNSLFCWSSQVYFFILVAGYTKPSHFCFGSSSCCDCQNGTSILFYILKNNNIVSLVNYPSPGQRFVLWVWIWVPHVGDCASSMSTSTTSVSATKGEKGKAKYAALNINNLYKVRLDHSHTWSLCNTNQMLFQQMRYWEITSYQGCCLWAIWWRNKHI